MAARLDEIRVEYIFFLKRVPLAGMPVVGGAGEGLEVEEGVGVQGRSPGGGGRLPRNELKMFHEQIVSRNKATR